MKYILATHNQQVQWYVFSPDQPTPGSFKLINELDLAKVPIASNKETAKNWALQLGLKTWRYVKI